MHTYLYISIFLFNIVLIPVFSQRIVILNPSIKYLYCVLCLLRPLPYPFVCIRIVAGCYGYYTLVDVGFYDFRIGRAQHAHESEHIIDFQLLTEILASVDSVHIFGTLPRLVILFALSIKPALLISDPQLIKVLKMSTRISAQS